MQEFANDLTCIVLVRLNLGASIVKGLSIGSALTKISNTKAQSFGLQETFC